MSSQNIIFLEYSLILKDVVKFLREYGHNLYGLHPRSITVTHFIKTCMQYNADWFFGINLSPEIAYLCSRVGIPYISWTIDPISYKRFKLIDGTNAEMCICSRYTNGHKNSKFRCPCPAHNVSCIRCTTKTYSRSKKYYRVLLVMQVLWGIRCLMT